MIRIEWARSEDANIQGYYVQAAPMQAGPYIQVADVEHNLSGPNYDATTLRFFYEDSVRPVSTWFRIIAYDDTGNQSFPSDPFQAIPDFKPVFYVGATPFGIFDHDPQFQSDADPIAEFVRTKLGDPVMEVHVENEQIYAAFEEACLEYSAMVNSYQAKSALSTFLGSPTGSLSGSENKFTSRNLAMQLQMADAYAAEAEVNSNLPVHSASITIYPGQQNYDLKALLSSSGHYSGTGRVRIREVYHRSPTQAYRFFGTTSALNYLNNQFRFESYTPETIFYLLPVWEDILRGMQFKASNNVRRSNYSYALYNNVLKIFPTPMDARQLWFEYTVDPNPAAPDPSTLAAFNGVSNLSNIPFGNIAYSNLNSISKHWIRRMALAMAKEIEGQIRAKMAAIPIPNGDLNLNGPELISDARAEMEQLRSELKEMLEETTYQKLMEREMQMAQSLQETFKNVPMGIFVG